MIKYFSIANRTLVRNFYEAVLSPLTPEKSLYFPTNLPSIHPDLLANPHKTTFEEMLELIFVQFLETSVSKSDVRNIIERVFTFDYPLVSLSKDISILELFYGPTLAFKDTGAKFLAACLSKILEYSSKKTNILVATSGDTGGAVAHGFYQSKNVQVILLYPKGRVSKLQEKQFASLGKNILCVEIEGSFDDCQHLVKTAFADKELSQKITLTSANSINIARWIPQLAYYLKTLQNMGREGISSEKIHFYVPCGNLGNLASGLLLNLMGFKIGAFTAVNNLNDTFHRFVETGKVHNKPSVSTMSNAMDVGSPNNLIRIQQIFNYQHEKLKAKVTSKCCDEKTTRKSIKMLNEKYLYLCDPHGAVAFSPLMEEPVRSDMHSIVLETAHYSKFKTEIEMVLGQSLHLHPELKKLKNAPVFKIQMKNAYGDLKDYILELN